MKSHFAVHEIRLLVFINFAVRIIEAVYHVGDGM